MQIFFVAATFFGDDRHSDLARHLAPATLQVIGAIVCILVLAALVGGTILGLRINPLTACPDPTNAICGYR